MASKRNNRVHPETNNINNKSGPRQLVQGSCVCCHSHRTLSSQFYPLSPDGRINGVPLLIPKIHKDDSLQHDLDIYPRKVLIIIIYSVFIVILFIFCAHYN